MASDKKLAVLISCLSATLTTTLLLLQLYGLLLIKIIQQQQQLQYQRNEAIMARNTALSRYRRMRLRLIFICIHSLITLSIYKI